MTIMIEDMIKQLVVQAYEERHGKGSWNHDPVVMQIIHENMGIFTRLAASREEYINHYEKQLFAQLPEDRVETVIQNVIAEIQMKMTATYQNPDAKVH